MKGWAIVTVGLYLAVLLLLTGPVMLTYYMGEPGNPLARALEVYRHWGSWLWIGVAVVSQVSLLAVPVAISERRPRSRRHVLVTVLTAAFLFTFVCVTALLALDAGVWGDKGKLQSIFGSEMSQLLWGPLVFCIFWTVWAIVFHRFAASDDPEAVTRRLVRWLLRGSILELLVAVPSHIVARHRQDCCAPGAAFLGIVTGITVMLLAFGPGVFFLFVERVRRKTSRGNHA